MRRSCNNCVHGGAGVLCGNPELKGKIMLEKGACSKHQTWKEHNPEDWARDHAYYDNEKQKWIYYDFDKNEMVH